MIKLLLVLSFVIVLFTFIVLMSRIYTQESFVAKNSLLPERLYHPTEFVGFKKPVTVEEEKVDLEKRMREYQFPPNKSTEKTENSENSENSENKIYGAKNFPTVDGVSDEFRSLNMFAFNKKSPACCGQSQYFGSGGCYCITNQQKKFLNNNGVV